MELRRLRERRQTGRPRRRRSPPTGHALRWLLGAGNERAIAARAFVPQLARRDQAGVEPHAGRTAAAPARESNASEADRGFPANGPTVLEYRPNSTAMQPAMGFECKR